MLPRWKTQFFIKFFEGGIIMQEGNRGQPKEDPFHVFVPLLPLNMAQNDISDSPIPSWNVPGPWNYPETAVSRQLLLTTALWNYAKSAPKFLNMGLTPPPFWTMFKKTADLVPGGTPKCTTPFRRIASISLRTIFGTFWKVFSDKRLRVMATHMSGATGKGWNVEIELSRMQLTLPW